MLYLYLGEYMKNYYKIYLNENELEYIGTVNSLNFVISVVKNLDTEHFMVIEHNIERNCDDIITYEIKEMLKENKNVSRGTEKVYRRT